jgi:uncharacterized membrane protein
MSFCPKCGAEVPEDKNFCTSCGAPLHGAPQSYVDPDDHTGEFAPEDRERNRYLACLCYLFFPTMFLALLAEPNSKFLRYHINQVILIYVLILAGAIVAIVPFLGWLACAVAEVASVVFCIMGAVRAFKGQAKTTPIIGKYTVIHWD